MHKLAESLELAQDSRAGIDVGDGQDFVLLLLQCLLDFVKLWPITDGCLELCRLDAVRLEAVGERVAKVPSVQDKGFVTGLSEVRSDLVPAKGARTGENERLRGGVGGLKELAQVGQDVAEGAHKGRADVGLAGKVSTTMT